MTYRNNIYFQCEIYVSTYECVPELVVTVPSARRTIVKKIKPVVNLHIFTNISQQSNTSSFTVLEILQLLIQLLINSLHFWLQRLSATLQATNRGDMVTDNTFGHKCVFSEIIQFYLFIYCSTLACPWERSRSILTHDHSLCAEELLAMVSNRSSSSLDVDTQKFLYPERRGATVSSMY